MERLCWLPCDIFSYLASCNSQLCSTMSRNKLGLHPKNFKWVSALLNNVYFSNPLFVELSTTAELLPKNLYINGLDRHSLELKWEFLTIRQQLLQCHEMLAKYRTEYLHTVNTVLYM